MWKVLSCINADKILPENMDKNVILLDLTDLFLVLYKKLNGRMGHLCK